MECIAFVRIHRAVSRANVVPVTRDQNVMSVSNYTIINDIDDDGCINNDDDYNNGDDAHEDCDG